MERVVVEVPINNGEIHSTSTSNAPFSHSPKQHLLLLSISAEMLLLLLRIWFGIKFAVATVALSVLYRLSRFSD